jgi:tRNA A-37 threonylcarbamoyl transferase component Bud32
VIGYTILAELGRGSTGVVYKARHEKLKRVVALKMVLTAQGGSREMSRFLAEAEVVARLHHPNIVQIYEVGEHDGRPYLALEFVSGGTLRRRLNSGGQPIRASTQLVAILARAVHLAHLRGIVHRDLKPANILLARPLSSEETTTVNNDQVEAEELFGIPKITDFGLAKRLDSDGGSHPTADVMGTPLYMAPEQARSRTEEVGPPTDVYALGAILYELLTGRPPFKADSMIEILRQVSTDPPPSPRSLRAWISRDLEAIVLKCLEKDPRKRYTTAQALADDLGRFLNGEPVRARAVGVPERLWRWCLRNPVPASLLLTATFVLAFGLLYLSHLSDVIMRANAEREAAQQTTMLLQTMACYSKEVVENAARAGVKPRHDFKSEAGGIPFPVAFTIELSDNLKKNADILGMEVRIYSDQRFRFRGPPGTAHLDDWERKALDHLRANPHEPVKEFTTYKRTLSLRYATPLLMKQSCVDCHNVHLESQKKDWQVDDVRGVLEIIRPLGGDQQEAQERLRGTYALLGGVGVVLLTICGLVLGIGRRRRG